MHKIDYLEGLRGIAAFIVVLNHFAVAFYPALYNGDITQGHTLPGLESAIASSPFNFFYNGNFAVAVFFVLSGFVLSYNYFKTQHVEVIVSGAIRRYFRLVIPIAVSVLIAYIFMNLSFFYNKQAGEISYSTWWLSGFWGFNTSLIDALRTAFIGVLFFGDVRFNHILWTMRYEFFGAMLVFATLFIFRQNKYRYVAYLILVLWFLRSYYLPFILGLILSDIYFQKKHTINLNKNLKRIFLLIIGVVGLYLSSCPSGAPVKNTIYGLLIIMDRYPYTFFHILGALMLTITILNWKALQDILSNKLFTFLGKISFSMYLIHLILIGSLSSLLLVILIHFFPYFIATLLVFVISLPILFFISYCMYLLVDSKSTLLSKIIYNKIDLWK